MECCKFEPTFRIDCLVHLVQLFRNGELVTKKSSAIQHAACFVGCWGATLKDDPEVFANDPMLDQYCQELEKLVAKLEPVVGSSGDDVDPSKIDPVTIIAIIGLVINIISKLRNR